MAVYILPIDAGDIMRTVQRPGQTTVTRATPELARPSHISVARHTQTPGRRAINRWIEAIVGDSIQSVGRSAPLNGSTTRPTLATATARDTHYATTHAPSFTHGPQSRAAYRCVITLPPIGQRSIVMSESVCVCVSVCPRAYLRHYASDLHQFFCAC